MHTTAFSSFRIHHDGELDGPMIMAQDQIEIIVTPNTFQEALKSDGDDLVISGPDNAEYDRHFITGEPDWNQIKIGVYKTCKITAKREDIENLTLVSKQLQIQYLIDNINLKKKSFKNTIEKLDQIIRSIKTLI